jgi:rifampicin phosphotransferase
MTDLIEIAGSVHIEKDRMGGKSAAIARLTKAGFRVPRSFVITRDVYDFFVEVTGLRGRIFLELTRKDFSDMRWEEMWDTALRIRNFFLTTPWPSSLRRRLETFITESFKNSQVTVRSSAPDEDSTKTSFAGVHESVVNKSGTDSVMDAIKLVWASLWSDRAMMYRRELGLDFDKSSMAVLIQEFIDGEKSGIFFGVSPNNQSHSVIEAVYGLNQGLVDGSVEPDRWTINRETGTVESHVAPKRSIKISPEKDQGVTTLELTESETISPPLNSAEVEMVFHIGQEAEKLFSLPQDVEWTFRGDELIILQSRPITSKALNQGDERSWYRSLKRSLANLRELRKKVENDLIPEMIKVAEDLADVDLNKMSDLDLAEEITRRTQILKNWTDIYWAEFIPFAHAVRLFGQFYNDALKPEDPFEFVSLLVTENMLSVQRNRFLQNASKEISHLRTNDSPIDGLSWKNRVVRELIDDYARKFEEFSSVGMELGNIEEKLLELFSEFSRIPGGLKTGIKASNRDKEDVFLSYFSGPSLEQASELLELARFSYRLRDDDNIYLGRLESRLKAALKFGETRLISRGVVIQGLLLPVEVVELLRGNQVNLGSSKVEKPAPMESYRSSVRQLLGQPASGGFSSGAARVINAPEDLFSFKAGEVLICDAVDPNITFIVPLCAGIVERRGGMLIHGAIIAREYGIPCVTGVTDAALAIQTGDQVTVDGFLGIVTLKRN